MHTHKDDWKQGGHTAKADMAARLVTISVTISVKISVTISVITVVFKRQVTCVFAIAVPMFGQGGKFHAALLWTPWAAFLGVLGVLETVRKTQEAPGGCQEAPRGVQETARRPPRGRQEAAKRQQETARCGQEAEEVTRRSRKAARRPQEVPGRRQETENVGRSDV